MIRITNGIVLAAIHVVPAVATAQSTHGPARPAALDTTPPTIEHAPLRQVTSARRIDILARIGDPSGVAFPRLYYRRVGETHYEVVRMRRHDGQFRATIPGFAVAKPGIEYYLEAFDEAGNGPASHGTPDHPHHVTVGQPLTRSEQPPVKTQPGSAPTAAPWYKHWWIWAIGGAVVAGATTAIAIGASGGGNDGSEVMLQIDAPMPQPSVETTQ